MWNVFKDIVISNSRKFILTVEIFKFPSGKSGVNLYQAMLGTYFFKSEAWKRCIINRSISCLTCRDNYKRIRNEVCNATRTILRAEHDSISKQFIRNQKIFWNLINTKTKNVDSFGDIKYVQVDGSECLAKTDALPVKENLSRMPNIRFDGVNIASRFKKTKCK